MGWDHRHSRESPLSAGARGRCPVSGRGALFTGLLETRPACPACGADFAHADSGDGPAVFVILILAAAVVLAAILVETAFTPAVGVHMAVWPVVIVAGALGLLRPVKGVLIAQQVRTGAGEAGLADDG